MKKKVILFVCCLFICAFATGEPFVEQIIKKQNQVIISGNFSAKQSKQIYFSDFDQAKVGELLTGFNQKNRQVVYKYSKEKTKYPTDLVLKADMSPNNQGAYARFIFLKPQNEIYFSYKFLVELVDIGSLEENPQLKLARLSPNLNKHTGETIFASLWDIKNNSFYITLPTHKSFYAKHGIYNDKFLANENINNSWWHNFAYIKLESSKKNAVFYRMQNEKNDIYRFSKTPYGSINDLSLKTKDAVFPTWQINYTNPNFATLKTKKFWQFILPFYKRKSSHIKVYIDDLYINNSPERVEIANNKNYNLAKKRQILETTNRSKKKITAKINKKNLSLLGDELYLFVFNQDGKFNSLGKKITLL